MTTQAERFERRTETPEAKLVLTTSLGTWRKNGERT
jgi:hypothetical protein